ncbi:hypothetical protein ACFQU7_16915 [Pseudoroseomonas wenyumeiae]
MPPMTVTGVSGPITSSNSCCVRSEPGASSSATPRRAASSRRMRLSQSESQAAS